MYKATQRSLTRRLAVHTIAVQPVTYHSEDDFIQSAGNMSERECEDERTKLMLEKGKAENQLVAAKNERDLLQIDRLGLHIQSLCVRLSLLKKRLQHLRRDDRMQAWINAAKEIVPPEMLEHIHVRQAEIVAASALESAA